MPTPKSIERTQERLVYENQFLKFYDDDVVFPGGVDGRYVRVRWNCGSSVAVVPWTNRGTVLVLRQFCYAADKVVLQIPKGFGIDGVASEEVARRELREELGASCASLSHLSTFRVDPGFIENSMHVFLARGTIVDGRVAPEATEVLDGYIEIDPAELVAEAVRHGIQDPVTLASVMLASNAIAKSSG